MARWYVLLWAGWVAAATGWIAYRAELPVVGAAPAGLVGGSLATAVTVALLRRARRGRAGN